MGIQRRPTGRSDAFLAFMILASLYLVGRLFTIQFLWREGHLRCAPSKAGKTMEVHGHRGRILDRFYRVLAESVSATTVAANPEAIQKWAAEGARDASLRSGRHKSEDEDYRNNPLMQRTATAIAATLGLDYNEVLERLCRQGRYVRLAVRADAEAAQRLQQAKLPGLIFEPEERREYPFDTLASAILGFCSAEQKPMAGVEWSYRQITEGECVKGDDIYDRFGRRILRHRMGDRPDPAPGKDLVLTIHLGLQQVVEKELDQCIAEHRPLGGANIVVLSARDGAIMAMGCRPTYNPNDICKARGHRAPVDPKTLLNRPVARPMDPGSSFKILTVACGLETGAITENSTFFCRGTDPNVGGRPLKCWGEWASRGHGWQTPAEILANSCNLGAAQIAQKIGAERFRQFLTDCGIGQYLHSGLTGENPGFLRPAEKMKVRDLACLGFGQGVLVTDLQLAAAVAAVVNGGLYFQPHIAMGYVNPTTNEPYEMTPRPLRRVCKPEVSAAVRRCLRYVVEHGTGRVAAIPGVVVGAKTATAQIYDPDNKRWMDGPHDYQMGFVLTAPCDRPPDFVIVVTVERPQVGEHGSDVCGPIARRIAQYLLTQPGLFQREQKQPPTAPATAPGRPAA
jgi:stage V sporulation protein D (sporulation-specific penicillin-binding protein)